ncbi:hypothetical protein [Polaromonas sp. YR568]|uniref:hypothetical protein n=1 Tax=Polaromonas sp. YR568 TaxID=1855301 RepID=UPI00398BCA5E
MAFVIKPIVRKTFDAHWTPAVMRQLKHFTHPETARFRGLGHPTWALDEHANASLVPVCLARTVNPAWCYAFVMNGKLALIRHESFCVYSFVWISPGLIGKLDLVKDMIAEALRIGGEFLDGKTGVDDVFSVPDAQFLRL